MKKIKTFQDACKALKVSPFIPDYTRAPKKHQKALIAHYKLLIIIAALNDGWEPNWDDENKNKYYVWFYLKKDRSNPSGFLFTGVHYFHYSHTDVGSRLCFKSREIAEYASKQFYKLFKDYYLIK